MPRSRDEFQENAEVASSMPYTPLWLAYLLMLNVVFVLVGLDLQRLKYGIPASDLLNFVGSCRYSRAEQVIKKVRKYARSSKSLNSRTNDPGLP